MSATLTVGARSWDVSSSAELHALFSTISHRVEPGGWGSRFPVLMNKLYQGELAARDVPAARRELAEARGALAAMPPSGVVWDIEDLSRLPQAGDDVDPAITHLADYFLTNDGENLIAVIDAALAYAERKPSSVTLRGTDRASIPELGLLVGANVWGIGDRRRIDDAFALITQRSGAGSRLDQLLGRLTNGGLEGTDLAAARSGIAALRSAVSEEPPAALRTQDGRDLLPILDDALAYAARSGQPARIVPVLF